MSLQWQFEQDDKAQWTWKRVDTEEGNVDSPAAFDNHTACIISALRFAVQRRRTQVETGRDGLLH